MELTSAPACGGAQTTDLRHERSFATRQGHIVPASLSRSRAMRKTRPRIHRVAAEVVEAEDRPPAGGVQAVRQSGLPGAARTGDDDDAPAVRGWGQPEVLAVSPSVQGWRI